MSVTEVYVHLGIRLRSYNASTLIPLLGMCPKANGNKALLTCFTAHV